MLATITALVLAQQGWAQAQVQVQVSALWFPASADRQVCSGQGHQLQCVHVGELGCRSTSKCMGGVSALLCEVCVCVLCAQWRLSWQATRGTATQAQAQGQAWPLVLALVQAQALAWALVLALMQAQALAQAWALVQALALAQVQAWALAWAPALLLALAQAWALAMQLVQVHYAPSHNCHGWCEGYTFPLCFSRCACEHCTILACLHWAKCDLCQHND